MMHPISEKALLSHIAILGKTGSGKTWAAKTTVEHLLDAGARVCIIDPTGAWHGLRSSATGKSAGYPVIIFGGSHADLPLGAAHGEALAEVIGTSSTPAIIDTSQMKVGERTRFFADFADALVRKNRGPLHLVIDEAHLFAPQGKVNDPQSGAMLHAANNLVSLGRSRGLRIMLITQRPAKLHKDSLTQVETLIAMRLIAPQDRKAVEEWIKDNADQDKGREIISSLATLKTGQAWIWAPELGVLERVQFPKIRTFDSSRAPDAAGEGSGPVLAPIDREVIAAKLQTVAADALANDPARLKAKIRELEAHSKKTNGATPTDIAAAEEKGYQRGLNVGRDEIRQLRNSMRASVVAAVENAFKQEPAIRALTTPEQARRIAEKSLRISRQEIRISPSVDDSSLPIGEASVLRACIQYPNGLRREQLTVLTGYKRSSRDAYMARLKQRGFIHETGAHVLATQQGVDAMPDAEPLPSGTELQDFWLQRLPEGEKACLKILIESYPDDVERASLDEMTGYQRSSRDAYLARLAAKELVKESTRGRVQASETLF